MAEVPGAEVKDGAGQAAEVTAAEVTAAEVTAAEMLAQLRDIRLPEVSDAGILADWAAGAMLGLLTALALLLLLRGLIRRIPSQRHAALQALAASSNLEPGERLLAQARLLQALAAKLQPADLAGEGRLHWSAILERKLRTGFFSSGPGAALSSGLYNPDCKADPDRLEQELRLLLRRVRR